MRINIFEEIYKILKSKEDMVLVTVVGAKGSTPRGAGARMIVKKDSTLIGTVGGGTVENSSAKEALSLFSSKKGFIRDFDLAPKGELGMVCNGNASMLFQYLIADEKNISLYEDICAAISQRVNKWIVIDCQDNYSQCLYSEDDLPAIFENKAGLVKLSEKEYYIERVSNSDTVYIFGGGHVSQETVPILSHVGFHCVVLESRDLFTNREYFPTADEIHCINYTDFEDLINITERDYVVLVTNTHQNDLEVLKRVLKKHPYYVGAMGSIHKIDFITKALLECGFTSEEINACNMPIGLNIKAETPAEIAISVAGELIEKRALQVEERR